MLKVKKLGPKAFTQCAGFLRITDGDEPLDQTSIHPESYEAARKLMQACGITKLGEADISFPKEKTAELGIDEYTLEDIEESNSFNHYVTIVTSLMAHYLRVMY